MIRRRSVMVYGTYPSCVEQEAREMIAEYVALCARGKVRIITRGGQKPGSKAKWPGGRRGLCPIDNLVIDEIQKLHGAMGSSSVDKRYMRTYRSKSQRDAIDIGQEILSCPDRRYEMYSLLLDEVDLFIFVGGADGVLRLGLLCHFLKKPFIIISGYGGAAEELSDSLYGDISGKGHYQHLRRDDRLELRKVNIRGKALYDMTLRCLEADMVYAVREAARGRITGMEMVDALRRSGVKVFNRLGNMVLIVAVLVGVGLYMRESARQIVEEGQKLMGRLIGQ